MSTGPDREIAGEVVRVEAVSHLSGATANSVASLVLLGVGTGLWVLGRTELGLVGVGVAWVLSVNALSLYGWDRLRDAIESRARRSADDGPDRTLTAPSLSAEHKAELGAGLVQVLAFVGILALTIEIARRFGVETGAVLLAGPIAVGNLGALTLVVYRMRRRERSEGVDRSESGAK